LGLRLSSRQIDAEANAEALHRAAIAQWESERSSSELQLKASQTNVQSLEADLSRSVLECQAEMARALRAEREYALQVLGVWAGGDESGIYY
jgi:hypothetical protein